MHGADGGSRTAGELSAQGLERRHSHPVAPFRSPFQTRYATGGLAMRQGRGVSGLKAEEMTDGSE